MTGDHVGYHVGSLVTYVIFSFLLVGQTQSQGVADYDNYNFLPDDILDLGKTPLDIVFVIDTSQFTNLTLQQEDAVKVFLTSFVNDADIDSGAVKVALVTYSTHPNSVFGLDDLSTKEDVINEIFGAEFTEGERNTADALALVRSEILPSARPTAPNVILLFQTGQSDRNNHRTLQEAEALKYSGANIFVVGYGMDEDGEEEANFLSSKPVSENTLYITDVQEFDFAKDLVFAQIFMRASQTLNSPAAGSELLDVVFLVHFSNTMKKQPFGEVISFMKSVLEYAAIDDDKVRVAAVLYRKRAIPLFDFNKYFSKDDVLDGIGQISHNYRSKLSSAAAGFDAVREQILIGNPTGERPNAPDLVIMITDSNPDTDVSKTLAAAQQLKAKGATLFTVGINVTYPEELAGLATKPEFFVYVNDTKYLESQTYALQDQFVGLRGEGMPLVVPALQTTTTTTSAPTTTTMMTTTTTTTAPLSDANSDTADIVFLIHASKKTKTKDFKKYLLTYLGNLAMRPDNKKVKYAVVTYGQDAETIYGLQEYSKKKMIKKAFRKIPKNKRFKVADLTKALKYVRTTVFTPDKGDDPSNPNGIILISNQASKKLKPDKLQAEVDALNQDGISIFGIGVGNDPALKNEIELVSGGSNNSHIMMIDDFQSMVKSPTLTKAIANSMRVFHLEEMDVVFAIHASKKSKVKDVKNHLLAFLKNSVSSLDIDSGAVRVGLAVYGTDTNVQFDLNTHKKSKKLQKAVKKLKPKVLRAKGSNIVDMLSHVQTHMFVESKGDRPDVPNLLVIVTDEKSNADISLLEQQSSTLKNAGTKVLAIGVKDVDDSEIEILSSQPKSEYFFTSKNYADLTKSEELKSQLNRIKIFENYKTSDKTTDKKKKKPKTPKPTVSMTTTQPVTIPQTKLTKVPKRVETPSTTVTITESGKVFESTTTTSAVYRTDQPSIVPKVPLSDSDQADVVIALHMSPRASPYHTKNVQEFVKDLISDADVANGDDQIGLMMYAADPEIVYHINQYRNVDVMKKEIDGLSPIESQTIDASSALSQAVNMLDPYFNRRVDVPAAVIFITDEPSTVNQDLLGPAHDEAVRQGVSIFSVGIGMVSTSELEDLATAPENVMTVQRYGQVRSLAKDLKDKIKALRKVEVTTTTTTPPTTTTAEDDGLSLAEWMKVVPVDECSLGNSDLVIILDASTSVTSKNYEKMKQFTKDLLANADIDSGAVRVGILIYSTDVEVQFHLNEYKTKAAVNAAIDDIPYIYGSTNTADALLTMSSQMFTSSKGDRAGVPNTAIVVTDGVSNINSRRTITEAESARANDIHIYAVGIGLQDTRELDGIASKPISENSFNVKEFDELKGLDKKIFSAICPDKEVAPTTTPAPTKGCGLSKVDVVIILDASTSVTAKNFVKMQTFAKDIVEKASVDSGSVRIGVLIYSTDVKIQFHLNEYSKSQAIKDAIDEIPYIYGSTNSADALETMADVMFTAANGDRDDADNIAFMITDGISNINSRRTIPEAVAAREKNIKILAIGIGLDDTRELEGMASLPVSEHMFNVKEFDQLTGLVDTIFGGEACVENEPPVAVAGDDVTVQAPAYVQLDGLASTDDKKVVSYQWQQTGGTKVQLFENSDGVVDVDLTQPGQYQFTLTVFDEEGLSHEDSMTVTVEPPPNEPPVADAGRDVTMQLPEDSVTLDGRDSTDDVQVIAYQWNQVSGPTDINVGNEESALLDLSELKVGEYEFSLSVFDQEGLLDQDNVRITVLAPPNEPPVANAGRDVTMQLPENSVTLDGRGSTDDTRVVAYQWSQVSGPTNIDVGNEESSLLDLSNLKPGEYEFSLTVFDQDGLFDDDTVKITVIEQDFPPLANAGEDVEIQMPDNKVTLDGGMSSDDKTVVSYSWVLVSGDQDAFDLDGGDMAEATASGLAAGNYTLRLTVSDELGQTDEDEVVIYVKERDPPPIADAGEDVTIQLPTDSVNLNGLGSTDNEAIVQYEWAVTVISGSDGFEFLDSDTATPSLSGLAAGEYEVNLVVTDSRGQQDTDTLTIIVKEPDLPPTAIAGKDLTLQFPKKAVNLDGSKSTDDVKIVSYKWSIISGDNSTLKFPGGFTKPVLKVRNLKPGQYQFQLEVQDELGQSDTDTVAVTVTDDPPVAVAGDDQTVQLPSDDVTLYGERSYDDVKIVSYSWRLVSGNPSVVLDGPDQPNPGLLGLQPGDYEFELTVTDESGQQDTDNVTIVVLPEPTTTSGPVCGLEKTDLVFVVDASTSVTQANFDKQLKFMKSIIEYADIDSGSVQIGALIYSTEVEIQFHLNQYKKKADILAAVDRIPYIYGSTNTADGLQTMRNTMFSFRNGDRDDAPNIAMVITDGVSNINSRRTVPEAEESRDIGIHVYAIGIGLTDTRELFAIASEPSDDNTFAVQDFDELAGLEKKIFSTICITEETTMPTTTTTTTTTTTPAPTTEPPCGLSKTDLVFILDASTSVTEVNFQKMRNFLKDFLRNADINSGAVRVGVNIYSTDVEIRFHLNEYSTEQEIYDAIDTIPYIYGSTNTADALQTMATQMFTPSRGDRPDAPNIAILLTDGVSNINSRRTIPEAESARGDGIHVYVIGIGLQDTREVEGIASKPVSKNLFAINSFDELKGLDKKIFSSSCPSEIDEPPVADAGKDVFLQLPDDSVRLSGDRSTDDKGIVTYIWSQIQGPRVNVIPSDNPYLNLDNLKEGEYVFELEVIDESGNSDSDTVEVIVLPEPDLPPTANAGPDQRIQLPEDSVSLSGRLSTDDKGIVEYSWELTSPSDGRVTLRGDDSPNLDVNNLSEGEYTFTLTVKDKKGQSDSDSAKVIVKAAKDLPPVANAGKDYDIQLPVDSVTLDGSASTDDYGIVSYDWTILSGNTRGVRRSSTDPSRLTLDGLNEGTYEVQLTVTDKKGQTSTDTATINVKRAVRTTGYDVIFILDSSVSPDYFRWMKNYARNVIREMSIDDEEFRVGFLIYSNGAYRQFDLNRYNTKADVLSGVDAVGYRPGGKNTAEAFKFVRNRMFTRGNGDRDFAKNYVIHLTGGDDSRDPFDAATEACRIQADGTGMFAVGFGEVPNTDELDAYSSLSTEDYRMLIRAESEMGEMPGLMLYQLKRGSPRPSPCPVEVTTTRKPGVCNAEGDVVFILDSSGSVGQDNFYRVLNFTYNIIDELDIDNGAFRVGCETFSDASRLDFNLNEFSTKTDLKSALTRVEVVYMYGNTHTAHALRRARTEMFTPAAGDRPNVQNIVVIVTDGQSNVNHELTIPEANSLKASGVSIITVAVGFTSETSELDGITSQPTSENLYYVSDYKSLEQVKSKMIDVLCSDTNMCRTKPCQNGGTCYDGVRSFRCVCPPEYFGETCDKKCGEPADVVIVMDSSDTVGRYNFGRLKEYAEHLVRQMNKDSCDINLGFMKYSSAAMVQVSLGMHSDTETNIRALNQISYSRGRANMAAAFRALRTQMFNGGRGDRPSAKNIAYFLTDGTNDVMADRTEPEAELTISSGVRVIPIGVNLRERYELDNIAQNQGINVIEISDEPGLIENTDSILRPLYQGSNFCDEQPCSNGGQCINEPFGYRCDCPVGYTGDTCQKRCSAKGDVVFAVDTSRYVSRSELKKIRRFLRSVVKRMNFKREKFSVGMVQFTDWAKVILDFNEGRSKKAVRSGIAGLRVHGGDPEPATALAKANYRIFNAQGASRDKPDYLILVTKSMRREINILNEASKLKLQGTQVLGVGIGLSDNEKQYLQSAVSLPSSETALFADDVKTLSDIADQIVGFMCDDENLCANNPCQNGGTCARHGGDYFCECMIGWAGRHCENRCQARADIIFLLDSSGSVGHEDFRRVKQFVHNMVGDLQIGKDKTRVGLTTYSSNTRHGFYMKEFYDLFKLQSAIAGINYEYGNTNTAAGLKLVRERYFTDRNGNRPNVQDFLVIITDGVSNIDPDQTFVEAQLLKDLGVHVYAVGIGQVDTFEINSIASEPASDNAYILKDYTDLKDISSNIIKATCRDPTVCDENPCQNGGLCVPGINGAFCECRAGYRGVFCEDSCVTVKDIMFLVDSSDSVGATNFQTALNFVSSIVEEFSGKDSYNRFSLITFGSDVQIVFSLGRYTRFPILSNAIRHARYRPGNTNTAGALRTAEEISTRDLGDRSDAENIIFMLVDGNGNVNENDTLAAAEDLKNAGARIITLAINMQDYAEVSQIASGEQDVFRVNSYNDLPSILDDIILTTCKNGNEINE